MKSYRNAGALFVLAAWTAITAAGMSSASASTKISVCATTGMVADLVRQVGGDRVEVDQLLGPGVDPHLFKATASDVTRLSKARVIFYSGLMLEGRMGEIFIRMKQSGKRVYAVTDDIDTHRLISPKEFEGHHDPHVWFDVSLWAACIPVVTRGLCEEDPAHAAEYKARGDAAMRELTALHEWAVAKAEELPPERRILVTSHDAYNYFGRAYGFKVVGLQGVSTVAEAGLADIAKLVDFIRSQGVPAIFVESSVAPTTIQRVAKDAGVKVGGELFSDAMGSPGEKRSGFEVSNYDGMVRYNLTTIVDALKNGKRQTEK